MLDGFSRRVVGDRLPVKSSPANKSLQLQQKVVAVALCNGRVHPSRFPPRYLGGYALPGDC